MTVARLLKFLGAVAASSLLMHVVVAAAVAGALHVLYPHRIFNARTWPYEGAERFQLVGSFLRERASTGVGPLIGVAGSSVSYGYPWTERYVFSRLLAERRPGSRVINASIIAADATGINDFIVCAASRNQVRFNVLIVEIPVVNTAAFFSGMRQAGHPAPATHDCANAPRDPGYVTLAATRLLGVGWFPFLSNSAARATKEEAIRFEKVPPGYFTSGADFEAIRRDYVAGISTLLNNAQRLADVVYAFPSPIFVSGLDEVAADSAALLRQLETTVAACRAAPGIRCLDSASLWSERSYYYNLTHLSQAGHRAAADLLDAAVP